MLSHLIGWVSHLAGGYALILSWTIAAGLIVLLVGLSIGLVRLWPLSRRWAAANRLHRLASRNEASLRRDARRQLDGALRTLGVARRSCTAAQREENATQIDRLVRRIEVIRDRVASDYVSSPANAPRLGRQVDLDRLLGSEAVASRCGELARRVRDGVPLARAQLSDAERAVQDFDERALALP